MKKVIKYGLLFILIVVVTASLVVLIKRSPTNSQTTNANPIITKAVNATSQTTSFSGNLNLKINGKNIPIKVDFKLSPSVQFNIKINLSNFDINDDVEITYIDNYAYIVIGTSKYKFDTRKIIDDLPFIQNILKSFIPNYNNIDTALASNTTSKKDIFEILSIDVSTFDLSNIDLSSMQDLLKQAEAIETRTGYEISLNIKDVINAKFQFDKQFVLQSISTDEILVMGNIFAINYTSNALQKVDIKPPTDKYLDLTNITDIVKSTKNYLDEEKIYINFNYSTDSNKDNFSGTIYIDNTSEFQAYIYMLVSNKNIIVRIQDNNYFLEYGKNKYYGSLNDLQKVITQIINAMPNSNTKINTILKLVDQIHCIDTNNTTNSITLISGSSIKFYSENNKLKKVIYQNNTNKLTFNINSFKYSLKKVNKSDYTPFYKLNALTETNKNNESFITAIFKFLYSSKPAVNANITSTNYDLSSNIYLNFNDEDILFDINGNLRFSDKTTYLLDFQSGVIADYFTFGNTKVMIKKDSIEDFLDAISRFSGINSNKIYDVFKNSDNILDFLSKTLICSNDINLQSLIDTIENTYISSTSSLTKITIKLEAIDITITFNLKTNELKFDLRSIQLGDCVADITLTTLTEKTINRVNKNDNEYLDVSMCANLLKCLSNEITKNQIDISGQLSVKLPVIGTKILDVYARVEKQNGLFNMVALIDNLPTGPYMNIKVSTSSLLEGDIRHYVYLYIKNSKVYFERFIEYEEKEKIGGSLFNPQYKYLIKKEKICSGYFYISDLSSPEKIIDLLTPVFGVGGAITSVANIFSSDKTLDITKNLDKLITKNSYVYEYRTHKISFDLKSATNNKDFSPLSITCKTSNNKIDVITFEFSMGNFLKINSNNIKLNQLPKSFIKNYKNTQRLINADQILTTGLTFLSNGFIARTCNTKY